MTTTDRIEIKSQRGFVTCDSCLWQDEMDISSPQALAEQHFDSTGHYRFRTSYRFQIYRKGARKMTAVEPQFLGGVWWVPCGCDCGCGLLVAGYPQVCGDCETFHRVRDNTAGPKTDEPDKAGPTEWRSRALDPNTSDASSITSVPGTPNRPGNQVAFGRVDPEEVSDVGV